MRSGYYLSLAVGFILLGNLSCNKGTEFKRDPNLQLLSKTRPIREGWLYYDLVFPVWSVDDKIYYIASEDVDLLHPRGHIWSVNADGTDDTLWAEGKYSYLDISPGGNYLLGIENPVESYDDLFYMYGDFYMAFWTPGDIVLFDTVTKQKRRITETGDILSAVFISDDRGLGIVFLNYRSGNDGFFYRINLNGGSLELLYAIDAKYITGEGICFGFDISPDGRFLVGGGLVGGGGKVFDIGAKKFLQELEVEDWALFPRYSPDGTRIAFSTAYSSHGHSQLYVRDLRTKERRKLDIAVYPSDYLNFPYWSPDGTKLVFSATRSYGDPARRRAYEIWIANEIP